MPVAQYRVGKPSRPRITHDNGFLDQCTPTEAGVSDYLVLGAWELAYRGADTLRSSELPDALAAYNHFLHGNGARRTFSYERYVQNDGSGAKTLASAVADAMAGAEQLAAALPGGDGHFEMTGTAIPCGSGNRAFPYPRTENWQKAIGAHVIWLSAEVWVAGDRNRRRLVMDLTLHAEDRYNFNPGAKDIQTGVADKWNGVLECSGLGHQYMNEATLTRTVDWVQGAGVGVPASDLTISGQPWRAEGQPADRRTRL